MTDREYGQLRYSEQLFFRCMKYASFWSVKTKQNNQVCVIFIFHRRNGSTGKYRRKHKVDETSLSLYAHKYPILSGKKCTENTTFLLKKRG